MKGKLGCLLELLSGPLVEPQIAFPPLLQRSPNMAEATHQLPATSMEHLSATAVSFFFFPFWFTAKRELPVFHIAGVGQSALKGRQVYHKSAAHSQELSSC